MSFDGFGPTTAFLRNLGRNNTKEWFHAHYDDYQEHLLEPAMAFVEAIGPTSVPTRITWTCGSGRAERRRGPTDTGSGSRRRRSSWAAGCTCWTSPTSSGTGLPWTTPGRGRNLHAL
ncbi:MAG: DUF2461 domain-containing protein [Actinobacteria bacterium]|nr:MAG: DUF2461 domain-containing protein [Actinomycetota bacterium]